MRISYNREEDVLIIEVSEEGIDYAEEVGPMIVHFTKEGKPVLVEILDASDFLAEVCANFFASQKPSYVLNELVQLC